MRIFYVYEALNQEIWENIILKIKRFENFKIFLLNIPKFLGLCYICVLKLNKNYF